jgi:uncharacterized protein (UPF0332 family)
MSFNWGDYLTLATALVKEPENPGPSEAALRSAISRAYYAAFRRALDVAISEGYQSRNTGDDHFAVRAHFRELPPSHDTERKALSTYLIRLSKVRNQADYEDTFRFQTPRAAAHLAVSTAEKVFELLENLQ